MGFINSPSCNDRVQVRKRQADRSWPTYSAFVCCDLFFAQSSLQLSNTSRQDEKPDLDYYDYDECASLCSKCRRSNNLLVYPQYTNQ